MKKHGLSVLENMVLRKILGPEEGEVPCECRRLYYSAVRRFYRIFVPVKALIVCHVFSAAGRPVIDHFVANVRRALEIRTTRNR
jgi:hypothetical protein